MLVAYCICSLYNSAPDILVSIVLYRSTYCNAIFGVHGNRPCYKSNHVTMRLFTIDM